MTEYVPHERVWLKRHCELDESWVQERIAEDPAILGMGDLILRDRERMQPSAGRLDLLLQDAETDRRYELEIQLGATDESHIIRTIEYWDIERKRYPQYDHCAVIVAEDVTSRFLNIISLFNGFIPLIAIKMSALKVGGRLTLVFTTVLDELPLELIEEDEEEQQPADRAYWENRAEPEILAMAHELLSITQEIDPALHANYTRAYMGLLQNERVNNFIYLKPQKRALRLEIRLERSEEVDHLVEESGLDLIRYRPRTRQYLFRLTAGDVQTHHDVLKDLMQRAYENTVG